MRRGGGEDEAAGPARRRAVTSARGGPGRIRRGLKQGSFWMKEDVATSAVLWKGTDGSDSFAVGL